jgi:pimeloyl-ACP methyl ester carboxylesterase
MRRASSHMIQRAESDAAGFRPFSWGPDNHAVHRRIIDVDGREIRLAEWGQERAATTILSWHGLGADPEAYFDEVGPRLAEQGCRVLAVEAPDEPRIDALAGLSCGLVDALGAEPVVFVGASWGALVGLRLAATCLDRLSGLVLVDGGYAEPTDSLPLVLRRPSFLARAVLRLATSGESDAFREAAAASPSASYHALRETGLPVLLLVGSDDARLRRIRKRVPQLHVVELGAGHDLLAESPHRVAEEIIDWFRREGAK